MSRNHLFTCIFIVFSFILSGQEELIQYKLSIQRNSDEFSLKEMITAIHNQDVLLINIQTNNSLVAFESPSNLTKEMVQQWIAPLGGVILSFERSQTGISYALEKSQGGVNCPDAALICSNSSFTANSHGFGVQELRSSNRGCLASNEKQSSWYYIYVGTGGTLTMTISPNQQNDDYDFAIWGPFTNATAAANCPPTSGPTRCSWSAARGNTGLSDDATDLSEGAYNNLTDKWVRYLDVNALQVYILMIDNWSASGQPYDITWGGTAMLDCTPVILPIELASFTGKNENRRNRLDWMTATEKNNSHFDVERSSDGAIWEVIATVEGNGNSVEPKHYSLYDENYRHVVNYYRLNQFDYDGLSKKSEIIAIDNSLASKTLDKIINTMGQVVDESYKGMKIYIYNDGTIVKKMN